LKESVSLSGRFQADVAELGSDVFGSAAGSGGTHLPALKTIICEETDMCYGIEAGL
jgi:hypothetical protein